MSVLFWCENVHTYRFIISAMIYSWSYPQLVILLSDSPLSSWGNGWCAWWYRLVERDGQKLHQNMGSNPIHAIGWQTYNAIFRWTVTHL